MLDTMQAQWLLKVKEGCAQARVGLTLRGMHSGRLSVGVLMNIMGFVLGGSKAYLRSCISIGRLSNVTALQVPAPRLAFSSYSIALQIAPIGPKMKLCRDVVSYALALSYSRLLTSEEGLDDDLDGGCMWLQDYLQFMQQRHQPLIVTTDQKPESPREEACFDEEDSGNEIEDGIHQPFSLLGLGPSGTDTEPLSESLPLHPLQRSTTTADIPCAVCCSCSIC
jgi:hypothetical protein